MDDPRWLGPSEAARLLDCSHAWIVKLCKQGRLTFVVTPLGRLIDRDSLETLRHKKLSEAR